jgi:hypothetical protein
VTRACLTVDGRVATISIKNFLIGLYVMYPYFPETPRKNEAYRNRVFQRLSQIYVGKCVCVCVCVCVFRKSLKMYVSIQLGNCTGMLTVMPQFYTLSILKY